MWYSLRSGVMAQDLCVGSALRGMYWEKSRVVISSGNCDVAGNNNPDKHLVAGINKMTGTGTRSGCNAFFYFFVVGMESIVRVLCKEKK